MAALDASSGGASWSVDEWAAFPPLYTLQPVAETRAQQLKIWVELVHAWARREATYTFAPAACGAFRSASAGRALDAAGVDAVVAALVADGRAERLGAGDVFLYAARPADVAAALHAWAAATRKLGGVFTVLELREGDDATSPVHGADPRLVARALAVLEDEDKAEVFHGATSADAGVKFFRDGGS